MRMEFIEVYDEWKKETRHSHKSSALFDADKMINDFGQMVPLFFFRFVWEDNQPYLNMCIRACNMASDDSYIISTSNELSKYIELRNLNTFPFNYSNTSCGVPKWWNDHILGYW